MSNTADIELLNGEVHLWCFDTPPSQEQLDAMSDCLSESELARAARYRFETPRKRFVWARSTLRRTLARYIGQSPASISFGLTGNEKPTLLGSADLHFNLSHSHDVVVLAVSADRPIGVDVERIEERRDYLAVARHYFHPRELATLLAHADPVQAREFFYQTWTRKEAYIKGLGEGLAKPLTGFEIVADQLRYRIEPDDAGRAWSIASLQTIPGYALSLAAQGQWNLRAQPEKGAGLLSAL